MVFGRLGVEGLIYPFRFRSYQVEAIREIVGAVRSGFRVVVLKAGPGAGKTLISLACYYVLRRGLLFRRFNFCNVFVRTRSQISSFIRDLHVFFGELPTVYLNKGESCFYGVHGVFTSCDICPYNNVDYGIDLIYHYVNLGVYDAYEVLAKVREQGVCPYTAWRNVSSEFRVYTYPYLVNYLLRSSISEYLRKSLIVVDEFHNLEKSIYNISSIAVKDVESALNTLCRFNLDNLALKIRLILEGKEPVDEGLVDTLWDVTCALKDVRVLRLMEFLEQLPYEDHIIVRENGVYNAYSKVRFKFSALLRELIDRKSIILLISATPPSIKYMEEAYGIHNVYYVEVKVKMGTCIAVVDEELTSKYPKRNYEKYAGKITKLIKEEDKPMLIVFPSYDMMREIYSRLKIEDKSRIYVEHEKTKLEEVNKALEKGVNIVFAVAGGKITEGVEFKENPKTVVLVGVPYPPPSKQLEILTKGLDENKKWLIIEEQAWIRIMQSIGRALRKENTKIKVYLLDYRFKRFKERFKNEGITLKTSSPGGF